MDVAYWADLRILSTSNIVIVQWARILLINPLLRLPVVSCKELLSVCNIAADLPRHHLIVNEAHTLIYKILIWILAWMHHQISCRVEYIGKWWGRIIESVCLSLTLSQHLGSLEEAGSKWTIILKLCCWLTSYNILILLKQKHELLKLWYLIIIYWHSDRCLQRSLK